MNAAGKKIVIVGSTGSIGTQALDVARWRGYRVVGLSCGRNVELLSEQVEEFRPELVAVAGAVDDARTAFDQLPVRLGELDEVAQLDADVVLIATSGFSGLAPTLAALGAGRRVALANKEALAVAGPLVRETALRHGGEIVPVDSEHSALLQCLAGESRQAVASLVLTASGGPFWRAPADLAAVTPEQALAHPNWAMGRKVTIDSATLFNKGLEVLEAHHLFDVPFDRIEVLIHPQSLIHGLVRFVDGNIKAHVAPHDMRLPIQYAFEYPDRPPVPLAPLSLEGTWQLLPPDHDRFPALSLAIEAGRMGGLAPAAINAADEVAVTAFLSGRIRFPDIARVLEGVLDKADPSEASLEGLMAADRWARREAGRLASRASTS